MTLRPFTEKQFLLCDTTSVNLLAQDLLSKLKGLVHFASSEDLTLEFSGQLKPELSCSLPSVLDIEEEEVQQKSPNII